MRIPLFLGAGAAMLAVPFGLAAPTAAAPDTDQVCAAFDLGVPPGQIIERLGRNDARFNYWRARDTTVWPILGGECD